MEAPRFSSTPLVLQSFASSFARIWKVLDSTRARIVFRGCTSSLTLSLAVQTSQRVQCHPAPYGSRILCRSCQETTDYPNRGRAFPFSSRTATTLPCVATWAMPRKARLRSSTTYAYQKTLSRETMCSDGTHMFTHTLSHTRSDHCSHSLSLYLGRVCLFLTFTLFSRRGNTRVATVNKSSGDGTVSNALHLATFTSTQTECSVYTP